jgi:beta-lactam-binding protein with PASTA domain
MRGFFQFLFSRAFVINVALVIALFFVGIFGIRAWLGFYTDHGESIEVPDLKSYSLTEVEEILTELNLHYEVIDSADYNPEYPRGSVVGQIPSASKRVKEGRAIFLTINPRREKQIRMPDIIDRSKRQAISYLENYQLKIGELIYVPDMARDVVLGMEVNGVEVEPGDMIEVNSIVDLILGQGLSNEKVIVPLVLGLRQEAAEEKITTGSLNIGAVAYDDTFEEDSDTLQAVVYRQYPKPQDRARLGSSVDFWLTMDSTKVVIDSLYLPQNDTAVIFTDTLNTTP